MGRMKYLLDTNICVHLFRDKYNVDKFIDAVGIEHCAISEITVAELKFGQIYGKLKGGPKYKEQQMSDFLHSITVYAIAPVIDTFAKEKARLRMEGKKVDNFDLLIGCTAIAHKLTMVTENVKDFEPIKGIKIENWIERDN